MQIVFAPILRRQQFCFGQVEKQFAIEKFIAQLSVEALHISVFPRASRHNVGRFNLLLFKPRLHRVGNEFAAVVEAQQQRHTSLLNRILEHANNFFGTH